MKKLLTMAAMAGATMIASAQGTVNFANSASTLISAGGTTASVSPYVYAVFLAPAGTVNSIGNSTTLTDPLFQSVGGYSANHPTAVGRIAGVNNMVVTGGAAGANVDFLVRGWSANAGATWAEALAYWNNGSPAADMYIGQSLIGNDIQLGNGGAIASTTLFGAGATQVGGFNMALVPGGVIVPEPSSMVLAGLGAASLLLFRRRK